MTLPETFRCIETVQPGGPEVLRIGQRPIPTLEPGEVLIEVAAAGINRPDCFQRAGHYPPPPGASDILGLEVAGTVVARGPGVESPALGERVCALLTGGGYATHCKASARHCLPIPAGLSMTEAAALPETCFTVWSNVFDRAALKPGETVLVQGGASGIGTTAIQMARALGHRVFVTAGSADKCRACEQLGAERAINYKEESFLPIIKSLTGERGVDVILDMVGGDYLPLEIKALADEGRLVMIAFLRGAKATIDLAEVMRRRLVVTGSTLRPRPDAFKAAIAERLLEKIWPLIEQGAIRPVIHATFPLEEAAAAHALMESGTHLGKIVLTV